MGSMAPYFSVYPLPAQLPTNAAVLASQHLVWTVAVLDGDTELAVAVEPFASALAIRPARGWPPGGALVVVARLGDTEIRHPFVTAASPLDQPPRCDWSGPSTIDPKSPVPPPDSWPTNIPRPPRHQRTFALPRIDSAAGYLVAAQLHVIDREPWTTEVALHAGSSHIALTPRGDAEFTDRARIIGLTLTDAAGNVARYGTTT
jgi:hypothetical protein